MSVVQVKPFVDKENDTIGLAKLGLNSFPGTTHGYPVPIKDGRFITGYDDKASYISSLSEAEKKKELARIEKDCKRFKANYDHLRICDCEADYSSEESAKKVNPFYNNLSIELLASSTYFNMDNIVDEVKLSIVKTYAKYYGDESLVAPNFKAIKESNRKYKFYVSDEDVDILDSVSKKKEINKVVAVLENLDENDKAKMLLIVKFLLPANKAYNVKSNQWLYQKLDDFIHGLSEGEKIKDGEANHKKFIVATKMPMDELVTKVTIKYALFLNKIRQNREKEYLYLSTGQEMGKSLEEVFNFLYNPKNTEVYKDLKAEVEQEIKIY